MCWSTWRNQQAINYTNVLLQIVCRICMWSEGKDKPALGKTSEILDYVNFLCLKYFYPSLSFDLWRGRENGVDRPNSRLGIDKVKFALM